MAVINKILLFTPASKFKSKILNLFGFSFLPSIIYLFTIITKKILKRKNLDKINTKVFKFNELNENGYLIIENFLKEKDLLKLEEEISIKQSENPILEKDDKSLPVMTLTKNLISSDILKNYFGPESQLFKFISISNGIRSSLNPEIEYREIINTDLNKNSFSDNQQLLHFDVTYNSYKAIFYLNEVNKKNGAFRIIPKSHKFDLKRFINEYLYGLSDKSDKLEMLYKKDLKNLKSLEGKKNTLIIMNSKSLHSRGIFECPGLRKTLFIDFRFLNSILNIFSLYKLKKSDK